MEDRVKKALEYALKYGGIDGAHHKLWVIDQMVRALTGCPDVEKKSPGGWTYTVQGESQEYLDWLHEYEYDGEEEQQYEWEPGTTP